MKAQRVPETRREWALSTSVSTGLERAALDDFVRGAWGRGPWVWVPVDAQHGNLLTPAQADFRTVPVAYQLAGPVLTSDGWTAASLIASTSSTTGVALIAQGIPVLPGVPVTGSIDVIARSTTEAPQVIVRAVDAGGASLGASVGFGAASTDLQRVSATLTPPSGAVSLRLEARYSARTIARPQVTWTPGPVPYHPPSGCATAVIDTPQTGLLTGWIGSGMLADTSYTIREVG